MNTVSGAILTFELREWELAFLPPTVELTVADRRLAVELALGEGRLVVDELVGGLRVKATSWVGVVRFEDFEIRVIPKQVGGNFDALRMLDYATGIGALKQQSRDPVRRLAVEGRSLIDLIGWLLADEAERILRDGPVQDYVTREASLSSLRGRLLYVEQFRRRFGQIDKLECRFDEFESDVLENQLIAAALVVARRICQDDTVRRRTALLSSLFNELCDPASLESTQARHELVYHRRNQHYRPAHVLAWLFLEKIGVDDLFSAGAARSFAFLIDMNDLFERFVTRLLRDLFAGRQVQVMEQRQDYSLVMNELTGKPYAAARPDVLLEWTEQGTRRRLPIDAKYKLYDSGKIDSGDVYQTFFYAYAYGREATADVASSRQAVIVYPGSSASIGHRLRVQDDLGAQTSSIRALGLDIHAALDWIGSTRDGPAPLHEILRAVGQPTTLRVDPWISQNLTGGPNDIRFSSDRSDSFD